MRRLIVLVAALAMALAMLGVPAHADDRGGKPSGPGGCGTKCRIITVQTKLTTWRAEKTFAVLPDGMFEHRFMTVSLNLDTLYYWWPDRGHADKMTPFKTELCYSIITGNSVWFDGAKAIVQYRGDVHRNTTSLRTPDNGNRQNCTSRTIPIKQRHWYKMGESPETNARGNVVLRLQRDPIYVWKVRGRAFKYFHPLRDLVVDDWHNIIKRW